MAEDALFKLAEFVTLAKQYNFARANRFEINITPPPQLLAEWGMDMRRINLLIEDTAFPGRTIDTTRLRLNGLYEQRARTIDYFGEAINFTFLVDDTWDIKSFFHSWQDLIIDPDTREPGFYSEYIGSVEIRALSMDDTLRHSVTLLEAFPRSFQLVQVANTSNAIQRFVVAFAFKRWTDNLKDEQNNQTQTDKLFRDESLEQKINAKIQAGINTLPSVLSSRLPHINIPPEPINTIDRILGR